MCQCRFSVHLGAQGAQHIKRFLGNDLLVRLTMFRYLNVMTRMLVFPVVQAWRRPRAAASVVLLVAVIMVIAGWLYARREWRAAGVALAADRPQEARAHLAFPLRVWWWDPKVHLSAARAARLSGDLPAAETHLKECLRLAHGATEDVQLEFLLLRVQTGEVDVVAVPLLEAANNGHPEASLILSTLAVAYMHNLRYRPAHACLSRWIEIQPDAAKAYQYRGWVLERMNRRKEAIADYQRALEIDANLMPVRVQLAQVLIDDHQALEALPHLERLYCRAPNDALIQARLGMVRHLQGRLDEARRLMEAAAVHLPNDPTLQIDLARLDMNDGQPDVAEGRLRPVVQADPSDMEAYYSLYLSVQAQGRADEAREIWKQCVRAKAILDRTNELLRDVVDTPASRIADCVELGQLFLEIKQDARGLFWLYRALERDPDQQQAHKALAAFYERNGNTEKAAAHLRQIRQAAAPSDHAVSP
jgi:tetratricopeptide (TPR) repeat protein